MGRLLTIGLLLAGLLLGGCGKAERPTVTLVKRETIEGGWLAMTFRLEHLERVDWRKHVLAANILQKDGPLVASGPLFSEPGSEFTIEIRALKMRGLEVVPLVLMWGNSEGGEFVQSEIVDLSSPTGDANRVTLPDLKDFSLTQSMKSLPPDQATPFDPEAGIDLITLGKPPNVYVVKVWATDSLKR